MSKLLEQIKIAPKNTKKIGDIVAYIADNRGKNPAYYSEVGIPVIDNFMITGHRAVDLSIARRFIDEETYKSFIRKETRENDILVTLVGNGYGQICLAPKEKSVIIQNTIGLRTDNLNSNFYLFYLLGKYKEKITALDRGAAQPSVKVGDLLDIDIHIPNLPIQNKIANILSAYDYKIENNNQIIKNLEITAQTIFNEWFVNFKFPGDKNVKMIYSEIGEIPDGWGVGNIETICNRLPSGKVFKENELSLDGSTPVYDQSSKGTIGFHAEEPAFNADIDNPILTFGDHTCRVQLISEPFSLGPNTIPLSGNNNYSPIFTFFLIKDLIEQREYKRHWNELVSNNLIIPEIGIVNQYTKIIKPFIKEINFLEKEKTFLKSQRDQLLAKLI